MRKMAATEDTAGAETGGTSRTLDRFSTVLGRKTNRSAFVFVLLGLACFLFLYLLPYSDSAVDPGGNPVALTREGRGAIGLLLLAVVWWMSEAVPIGVTAIAVGALQAVFSIRPAGQVFREYMDPSILFVFGSIVVGLAVTRSGLLKRLFYGALSLAGERTEIVLLGCLLAVGGLAHAMPHTAVAAALFPMLIGVSGLYGKGSRPSNFGKALFIGTAYAAGAGSMVTMLGSARNPVAIGMFREFAGSDISLYEFSKFMAPVGWLMLLAIWGYLSLFLKADRREIAGLGESVREIRERLGPVGLDELATAGCVLLAVAVLLLQPFVPVLGQIDKTAILLVAVVLLFFFRVLTVKDLEEVPWNTVLLYGGALSLGFCLWQTGAAPWLGLKIFLLFGPAPANLILPCVAIFMLVATNLVMNVAVLCAAVPLLLAFSGYSGVAPQTVLYLCVAAVGMPMLFATGAAPNAIAFESRQFGGREFFRHGMALSAILLAILVCAAAFIWPWLGMRAVSP